MACVSRLSVSCDYDSIYLFGRFFGAKHPNEGAITEMRDYYRWQ